MKKSRITFAVLFVGAIIFGNKKQLPESSMQLATNTQMLPLTFPAKENAGVPVNILPSNSQWCTKESTWGADAHPGRPIIYFYDSMDPYYEFTNFYRPENGVTIDGKVWPTTEHYYQATKFTDTALQEAVRILSSPRDAFNFTRDVKNRSHVRADWDNVKLDVMRKAVLAKFSEDPVLKNLLLSTGDAILVEDAGANDSFYGDGADCNGKNWLGKILMETREKLGGTGYK